MLTPLVAAGHCSRRIPPVVNLCGGESSFLANPLGAIARPPYIVARRLNRSLSFVEFDMPCFCKMQLAGLGPLLALPPISFSLPPVVRNWRCRWAPGQGLERPPRLQCRRRLALELAGLSPSASAKLALAASAAAGSAAMGIPMLSANASAHSRAMLASMNLTSPRSRRWQR